MAGWAAVVWMAAGWGAGFAAGAAAAGTMLSIATTAAPAATRRKACACRGSRAPRRSPPLINEADIAFPTRSARTDPARTMVKYGKYFLVTALCGSTGGGLAASQLQDDRPGCRLQRRTANVGKGMEEVGEPVLHRGRLELAHHRLPAFAPLF